MSEQESFITEVSDAVREDQLWGYVRRYGWIAGLAILALVGGAAWNEWQKSKAVTAARATGDSLLAALQMNEPAERVAALEGITVEGPAAAVTGMLTAASQLEAGDNAAAVASLDAVATNAELDDIYRDIAMFKSALIDEGDSRAQKLDTLAQPGRPLRMLAEEQIALGLIESGETDAAVAALRSIIEDAETTQSLRDRAQTLIVALGAPLEADAEETGQ